MRALVTGVAGFIGSHLAEALVSQGHPVKGIDCLTPYYDVGQKLENWEALGRLQGCQLIDDDLRFCDLAEILDGVDIVFHQAGQPGVRSSWSDGFATYVDMNILATQRLLEAVRDADVKRFVYASSSSVYGDAPAYPTTEEQLPSPRSPYGVTKLAAEHLCGVYASNWGLATVSFRYFTVYGPRQRPDMAMHRLIDAAMLGTPFPVYGDGSQTRDFTFVGDVVRANLLAMQADVPRGMVMNLAGGTQTTLLQVIGLVERLVGRPIQVDWRPQQPGDVERTGGSTRRAREVLAWRPLVGLADGLASQVDWQRKIRRGERRALTQEFRQPARGGSGEGPERGPEGLTPGRRPRR
jgi:UDP-glucuronate 4-epimerase